jgi:hypothetical protein
LAEGLSEKVAQPEAIESSWVIESLDKLDKSKCKNDGGFFMDPWSVQEPGFKISAREFLFSCFYLSSCPMKQ